MKIILTLSLIVLSISSCFSEGERYFLLTEYKASKHKSMGEVVVRDGQDWITPGAFDISFVVIMDIDRDEEFDISELTYTINVDSVYAFKEYRYVLLIVEKRDDIFKLIDWQILRRFFCISEDLVPSERSEFYFKMQKEGYKKKLCRAL